MPFAMAHRLPALLFFFAAACGAGRAAAKHILVSGGIMRSHHLAMVPAVEELARRGHRVVFAMPDTAEFRDFFKGGIPGVEIRHVGRGDWSVANVSLSVDVKNLAWHQAVLEYASMLWNIRDLAASIFLGTVDDTLAYVEEEKPDLVLAQMASFALVNKLLDAPDSPPLVSVMTGLPTAAFALESLDEKCRYPNIQAPDKLEDLKGSLALRVKNRLTCMAMAALWGTMLGQIDGAFVAHGVPPLRNFARVFSSPPVMVAYGGAPMMLPMPLPGNVHMVGVVEKKIPHAIAAPLLGWLDAAADAGVPVVYVSMGTKYEFSDSSGAQVVAALLEAVQKLGVRVLWSLRKSQQVELAHLLPAQDAAFRIEAFTPQPEVLAHRAVKAFLSHCGWGGVTDSLAAGVPVLGYPGFAEQFVNAMRIEELGAGSRVAPDFSNLGAALQRAIWDPSLAAAARRAGEELQALGGLERLVEIAEATAEGRSVEQTAASRATVAMDGADPLLTTPQRLEALICWVILLAVTAVAASPLVCCCALCHRTCRIRRESAAGAPVPSLLGRLGAAPACEKAKAA